MAVIVVEGDDKDEEDKDHAKDRRRTGQRTKTRARTKRRTIQKRRRRTNAGARRSSKPPGRRCHNIGPTPNPNNPSIPSKWLTFGICLMGGTLVQGRRDAAHQHDPKRLHPLGGGKGEV